MQRIDLNDPRVIRQGQRSVVDRVSLRMNGENEFLLWNVIEEQTAYKTITSQVVTPVIGGNGNRINTTNVVKVDLDVYVLPEGSEYKTAVFVNRTHHLDGSVTNYEFNSDVETEPAVVSESDL